MTPIGGLIALIAIGVCSASMVHIVLSDVRTRLISTRACRILGISGAIYQLANAGIGGLAVGLLSAMAITVANIVFDAVARFRFNGYGIGGGDVRCMAAIALATGQGCFVGALFCCGVAIVWASAMQAKGLRNRGEPFAFAPFMAIWLGVGVALGSPIWR